MEIGSPASDAGEADNSLPALWELDSPEYECDCPGPPPPPFRIPPPPRPPFLSEVADCAEITIADYESCDVMTVSTFNDYSGCFFFAFNFSNGVNSKSPIYPRMGC